MILARALAHQPPPLPPYHKSIRSAFTVHRFRYISRYRPQSRASSSGAMNLFCQQQNRNILAAEIVTKSLKEVFLSIISIFEQISTLTKALFRKINYFSKCEKLWKERLREKYKYANILLIIILQESSNNALELFYKENGNLSKV